MYSGRLIGLVAGIIALPAIVLAQGRVIIYPRDANIFNVRNFGAAGDGVTDDTAAIRAAMNAILDKKRAAIASSYGSRNAERRNARSHEPGRSRKGGPQTQITAPETPIVNAFP